MKKSKRNSKLSGQKRRSHTVSSRLNSDELSQLDTMRSEVNMKRGEYLRTAALENPPPIVPAVNQEKWVELGRLGGNINQIAKRLNEGEDINDCLTELRNLIIKTRIELLKV